jgi:GntR family transcriptional repressor for pyruvate dehydrogenase complex
LYDDFFKIFMMTMTYEAKAMTQPLSDTVALRLLAKIDAGEFVRGQKLPTETQLAEAFKVSRTVVREAISRLKNEGVVVPRQGSGVYVTAQAGIKPLRIDYVEAGGNEAVIHIVELRRAIEAEVAALAAIRRSPEDLVAIEQALAKIEESVQTGCDGVKADVAFHAALARATHNPYFIETLQFLSQYLEAATKVTRANEARRADYYQQVQQEHAALVAAIRAGDAAAARAAAQIHMVNAAKRLST